MNLTELIKSSGIEPHKVVKFDDHVNLDLSKDNEALSLVDLNDEQAFTDFVFNELKSGGSLVGVGGYGENRSLYSRSDLFEGEEPRSVHLGIDVWSLAGTEVFVPIDGQVHSFANRNVHGDYGPVIILRHKVDNVIFHTLYGHLSTDSLEGLYEGKRFESGTVLARMGKYEENFHWPPHLHFQVIIDLQDCRGDYPGVCKVSEKEFYLSNCPDPSIFVF